MGKIQTRIYLVLSLGLVGFISLALSKMKSTESERLLVRLQLNNYAEEMQHLQKMDVDVAGVNFKAKTADVIVEQGELTQLTRRNGLKIVSQTPVDNFAPDADYHTAQEVEAELNQFAAIYPHLAQVKSIGKSGEGRDILAIKISDNVGERETDEPTIVFNAMHHAREVMTTEIAIDTIQQLLQNYGTDQKITHWVDSNEIWVLPMVNPDGNNKVWTQNSWWRKNTRGGYGVDNNRNYPYAWNTCNGSSGSTGSETYRGPSAGSEPETQALMALITDTRPVFNISYHSYSELVLYPYGCRNQRTATKEVVEKIGKEMARLLPSDDNSSSFYKAGTPWETLYDVDGGDVDWMYFERQVIPYVIEVNSGNQGFQPRYTPWRERTVTKLRAAWGFLLDRLEKSGIRGVVTTHDGSPVENVTILVKNLSNTSIRDQLYKVNPDGTYHLVLNPGNYKLTVSGPVAQEHEIIVDDARIDMNLNL